MHDRAMQALYLMALEPVAETQADIHSYGFRPGRSTADAVERCFKVLCQRSSCAQWILEGDIKGCFDNIDHGWLYMLLDEPGPDAAVRLAGVAMQGVCLARVCGLLVNPQHQRSQQVRPLPVSQ